MVKEEVGSEVAAQFVPLTECIEASEKSMASMQAEMITKSIVTEIVQEALAQNVQDVNKNIKITANE